MNRKTSPPIDMIFARVLILLIAIVARPISTAAEPSANRGRLERQLAAPVTVKWANVSFRQAMGSLQDTQHVAIVIDRRIDADAPFALTITGNTLELALARIAQRKQTGYAVIAPVIYFGPAETCAKLQTLAALRRAEIEKLPPGPRHRMQQARLGGWSRLAEPEKLLDQLAEEAEVNVTNPTAISHDLWAEANLPAMPWSDCLTLVLAQFDLTFTIAPNARSIALVPIPADVAIEHAYPGGKAPGARRAQLQQLVPDARVELRGGRILVRARTEAHREIADLLAGKQVRKQTVTRGAERYKLKVAGLPLENVFAQLGQMLKLDIRFDRDAIEKTNTSLKQLISFEVADATLEELLNAALRGTGLTYELTGKTVAIRPAEK